MGLNLSMLARVGHCDYILLIKLTDVSPSIHLLQVGGEPVPQVERFKYLGVLITDVNLKNSHNIHQLIITPQQFAYSLNNC